MRKLGLLAILAAAGCMIPLPHDGGNHASTDGKSDNGGSGSGIHLTVHKVMDTGGTGKLAGTYLVPDGYTATDNVQWVMADYLTPVVNTFSVVSNDKSIRMDSMSGLQFNFGHAPAGSWGIDPPKSVSNYLLGKWKKIHQGLSVQVVQKSDEPIDDADKSGQGWRMFADRGIVKLSYKKNGVAYTEKINGRVDVMMSTPVATAIGGTMYEGAWVLSDNFDVAAPADKLPEAMEMFGIVLSSYKMDPKFFNVVTQAQAIIMKNTYAGIRRAGQISQIISQTNDRMTAQIEQSYHTSESVQEHEVEKFDDYIRGVDQYSEEGGTVKLPAGYEHAWTDGNGGYLVSHEHGLDPNVNGPRGTWTEMEKSN